MATRASLSSPFPSSYSSTYSSSLSRPYIPRTSRPLQRRYSISSPTAYSSSMSYKSTPSYGSSGTSSYTNTYSTTRTSRPPISTGTSVAARRRRFQSSSPAPSYSPSSYQSDTASRIGRYDTTNRTSHYDTATRTSRYETVMASRLSSPRPLPAGPGPLDEHGRKMDITSTLARSRQRSESLSRTGPVKTSYQSASSGRGYSPSSSFDSSGGSPTRRLSISKRTSSHQDLSAGLDNVHISSPTGASSPLSRSKQQGNYVDVNGAGSNKDRTKEDKVDSLYDSSSSRLSHSPVSKSYYSSSSHTYAYKDADHGNQGNDSPSLPEIRRRGSRSPSPPYASCSHKEEDSSSTSTSRKSPLVNGYASKGSPDSNSKRGLVGLKNIGNTCFMNSVLQCLSNTHLLLEYCINDEFSSDMNKSSSNMKGALFTAFVKLLKSMWKGNSNSYVNPTDFKSQIQKFSSRFMGYNQQDAQEFLIYLLEGLHEDVNRVKTKKKPCIIDDSGEEKISASDKARESWKRYLERDNSKMVDVFVGQLKSSLKCMECGYVSNTFDPFWDLSLPIKKRGYDVSLSDCFELFTQEEVLDGDEKPTCARCKERRKCTKCFSIQKFPKVLVLHLKRFSADTYVRSKLSTKVDFPLTDLNLTKFAAEKNVAPAVYNLFAVANHSGSPSFGHYTAYCRHPYTNEWYQYNDQRVSSVSSSRVVSSEGYVLFYELSPSSSRL